MSSEIVSALIGAGVGVATCLVNNLITSGKHGQRLDEHDKRFDGVDRVFSELDERFVPRNEIDARLRSLDDGQKRIESLLNMALSLVGFRKTPDVN